jgi:leader peptidase (prepilin peptidase) / N-methyltransferase
VGRVDIARPLIAAVVFFAGGWLAATFQHLLYREAAFREGRATGRRALLMRLALASAAAGVAALAFRPDHYDVGPAALTAVFGLVLLTLSSTDFERRRIPDKLSLPAFAAAVAVCWAWPDREVVDVLVGLGFALGVGAFVFGAGVLVSRSAVPFGMGDVKLMIVIGALLGWPATMYAVFIGMILGGVPAVALIVSGRSRAHFAYGPYLAIGGVIGLLWPERFM